MSVSLPQRRLVSQEDEALNPKSRVPRSKFTNSWTRKMTFDAGFLNIFMCDEVLPGAHLKYDITPYVRISTLLFPMFDNQRIDTFLFYCPTRVLWDNFVKMMGEQANPGDSIAYVVPFVSGGSTTLTNAIYQQMGIPVSNLTAGQTISFNALMFRMYNRVYNEWFRDQNLINSVVQRTTDNGTDANTDFVLLRRAKAHDYFTQALPWPQKFTAPTIPLAGTAPVLGLGWTQAQDALSGPQAVEDALGNTSYTWYKSTATPTTIFSEWTSQSGVPNLRADLASATGVSVNSFRQAFLVHQMLERDARGGTRYTELLLSHFDVRSPDARLQRPEYIGGGSSALNITPIAQTATGGGGLAALGGAGTASGRHGGSYAATEHGYILGLINVRSELSYQQGLHKMFTRSVRTDFYWPSLAELGEQAVLRQEIYCTGVDADDNTVFGYVPRWDEYRQRYSDVAGLFLSKAAGNIDEWHLAQEFTAAPTLGQTFIEDTPPVSRVLSAGAAANGMQYLADILIRREATLPMPVNGVPATLGRY